MQCHRKVLKICCVQAFFFFISPTSTDFFWRKLHSRSRLTFNFGSVLLSPFLILSLSCLLSFFALHLYLFLLISFWNSFCLSLSFFICHSLPFSLSLSVSLLICQTFSLSILLSISLSFSLSTSLFFSVLLSFFLYFLLSRPITSNWTTSSWEMSTSSWI